MWGIRERAWHSTWNSGGTQWFHGDKVVYFKKIFFAVIWQFSEFVFLQSLSHVWLFATPWTAAHQASLSITNSQSLLKLMSIESVMPSNHLFLCGPLLLPSAIFPSIRVFTHESVLHIRWPKYWSFCFSISPSSEYSGLISFRMDWFPDSQESSPAPEFESINSLVLSLLYGPTLTSIQDYGKNHSFDRPLSAKKWYLCF